MLCVRVVVKVYLIVLRTVFYSTESHFGLSQCLNHTTLRRLAHAESENLLQDNKLDCSNFTIATEVCFSHSICEYSLSNDCVLCSGDTVSDN